MTPSVQLALALVILVAEGFALYHGQRRLFWNVQSATGSRLIAYALAAPGTMLHEASHYLLCLVLGVPAGDRVLEAGGKRSHVRFFRPQTHDDGSVTLGYVPHAATDPLRQALIAIAPALLVAPLLAGITYLLLGTDSLGSLWHAVAHVAVWRTAIWFYVAFSCGQAAFPSSGDHVGVFGGLLLILLAAAGSWLAVSHAGVHALSGFLMAVAQLLAVPAAFAAFSMLALPVLARTRQSRRRPRRSSEDSR